MTREIRPLARALSLRPAAIPGAHRAWEGSGGRVAAVVGIGPRAAGAATERLLDAADIDRVLVVGVAGAVDPSLRIGDVLIPAQVIDRATGAVFQTRRPDARGILVTSNAIGGILAIGEPGADEPVAGGGSVPAAPSGTTRTAGTTGTTGGVPIVGLPAGGLPAGASAVDMETAAIARVCEARGVPWSVVRTISDLPGTLDNSVLELVRPDGGLDPVAIALLLARRPGEVAQLIRLGRDTQRAVRSLTRAVLREL